MSFDVTVSAFRGRKSFSYESSIVEQAFNPLIGKRDTYGWSLTGSFTFVYIENALKISHFGISRPSGDPALWAAVFSVLRQTPSVIYWGVSDGFRGCVADADVIANMPADMVEVMRGLTVVTDGMQILDLIEKS